MASIQDIRTVHNPQRAYEWEVSLVDPYGGNGIALMTQRAKSVSIPETSVDTIIINYKGRKAHYAGRTSSPSTVTVVFWDDEDNSVYNYFKDWMELRLSNSQIGGGQEANIYTAEMNINLLKHDSIVPSAEMILTRVFPTSIGDIQLSYEQSEHVEISVTFSFDSNLRKGERNT